MSSREVAGAPRVPGRLAAERCGELTDERSGAVQRQPVTRPDIVAEPGQALADLGGRLRADPPHAFEPACGDGAPECR